MKSDPSTRPQVKLEDLLRLKRAERPPAAFWADFDREMRAKQLAAIVAPRPWWAPFIRINARLARYQVPVGATAILAMTLVSVHEYRLPNGEPALPSAPIAQLDAMPGPTLALPGDASGRATVETDMAAATNGSDQATPGNASERSLDALPGNIARMVPMLGGIEAAGEPSPSARSIQANLAAVKASEPELARLIDHVPGLEAHSLTTRVAMVDPLTNMQSPSDTRRARVLSSSLPVVANASADYGERRYQPRLDRDLTDERLYERVSRVDLEGKRLAINIRL